MVGAEGGGAGMVGKEWEAGMGGRYDGKGMGEQVALADPGGHREHVPPLSQDLFSPALSLALLCMHTRRSARADARMCVGGDPTNAYLYCVYALVGGAISIRDPYICAISRVCAND